MRHNSDRTEKTSHLSNIKTTRRHTSPRIFFSKNEPWYITYELPYIIIDKSEKGERAQDERDNRMSEAIIAPLHLSAIMPGREISKLRNP